MAIAREYGNLRIPDRDFSVLFCYAREAGTGAGEQVVW